MAKDGAMKGTLRLQLMSSSMVSQVIKIPRRCKGKMALAQWVRNYQTIMGNCHGMRRNCRARQV